MVLNLFCLCHVTRISTNDREISTWLRKYEFSFYMDRVFYKFLETDTYDRTSIDRNQRLKCLGFSLYFLYFTLTVRLKGLFTYYKICIIYPNFRTSIYFWEQENSILSVSVVHLKFKWQWTEWESKFILHQASNLTLVRRR